MVPVCLSLVDKVAKHGNKGAISPLCLTIGLGVKSRRHGEMDIQEPTEFLPKATGKLCITVRDDGGGHSMQAKNIVEKNPGDLGCCVRGSTGDKMNLLRQFIHKHSDVVETAGGLGERTDKIHGDCLPRTIRDRERLKKAGRRKVTGLIPLARLAGLHVQSGILGQRWPEKTGAEMTVGLLEAKVTGYGRVMGIVKERETNVRVSRNANT